MSGRHLTLLLFALAGHIDSVSAGTDEHALKVAYLYNFIQFTQWPAMPPDQPFQLCVLGTTPLDAALDGLEGKPVLNGLRIKVRHVGAKEVDTCHALYIDDSQRKLADEVLGRLSNAPVLTVTDSDGLADRGLMIEIRKRDLKLGFEVNLSQAKRAKLGFSSRMLKLAIYVSESR
ncbi:YfiR family protein [Chitinivorax sp. B]|uniref:YfiR family protein n=1 Tax=Chitinivorax sp. B TaxID=2502235 RepID=UPI0010F52C69|nr:YfiR family protein [Chitinivorax sp. B]